MLANCLLFAMLGGWSAAAAGEDAPDTATPARRLVLQSRVLVIAHRGDSGQAPENTLPAFASAVHARADLVELDYYHSADGVPVVFHDKELDRTTDARRVFGGEKIPLAGKTLDQLLRLDAGAWFDLGFTGLRIPTLEQALATIQAGSTTLIERKGGDAESCVRLLQRLELLDRVVVQSFDWGYLRDCRRLTPQLTLAALGNKELDSAKLDEIQSLGVPVAGWDHEQIGAAECLAVHRRGLKLWVYTVNDPERARQLVRDGVDGLITDRPALIRSVLAGR